MVASMEDVGRIVFLVLGTVVVGAGLALNSKSGKARGLFFCLLFGFGFVGAGAFGLDFAKAFSSSVANLVDDREKSVDGFLSAVADGKVSAEEAQLGLAFLLQHPVEGLEAKLTKAAGSANEAGKRQLEQAAATQKAEVALHLAVLQKVDQLQLKPEEIDAAARRLKGLERGKVDVLPQAIRDRVRALRD